MTWGALLRRAVGMERPGDARALVDPKTGLPSVSPRTVARQTLAIRIALGGCLLVPIAAVAAYSSGYWTSAYQWYEGLRERFAGLSPHASHAEVLKFAFGDPSSVFYNDSARSLSGASAPPPLTPQAHARLPAKGRTIQHVHDYWHAKYGDEVYRSVFKAELPGVLLEDYLRWLWRNPRKFMLPDAWVRELPPEKIEEFSDTIERRWKAGKPPPAAE